MTVILLTSSTVLCYLPRTVLILSFLFQEETLADLILTTLEEEGWRVIYLLTTGLAIANSCINPLIFIVRSENIRWYWRGVLTEIAEGGKAAKTETNLRKTSTVLSNIMNAGLRREKSRTVHPPTTSTNC